MQHASLSRDKLVREQCKQMRDEALKDMCNENDPDVKKVLKDDFLDANRLWKEAIAVLNSSSSSQIMQIHKCDVSSLVVSSNKKPYCLMRDAQLHSSLLVMSVDVKNFIVQRMAFNCMRRC